MKYNFLSVLQVACCLAILMGGLATAAWAQTATDSAVLVRPVCRNAVRLDVGGVLAGNLANSALGNGGALLPLLASYERQVGKRFSVVGEALVNGGAAEERKIGLSGQGRYYVRPGRSKRAMTGFYLAPVLAYRSVQLSGSYEPTLRRQYAAAGALLGYQTPLKSNSRWFLDISAGLMNWQKVGKDKRRGSSYYGSGQESYYDTHPTDFDGRLGIGMWF